MFKKKNPFKASDINLNNHKNITRLILIYLYSVSEQTQNRYKIQKLKEKISFEKIKCSDFIIYKKIK